MEICRPRCAGAGKVRCGVRRCGAGAVHVRVRFYPARASDIFFVVWKQILRNKEKITARYILR